MSKNPTMDESLSSASGNESPVRSSDPRTPSVKLSRPTLMPPLKKLVLTEGKTKKLVASFKEDEAKQLDPLDLVSVLLQIVKQKTYKSIAAKYLECLQETLTKCAIYHNNVQNDLNSVQQQLEDQQELNKRLAERLQSRNRPEADKEDNPVKSSPHLHQEVDGITITMPSATAVEEMPISCLASRISRSLGELPYIYGKFEESSAHAFADYIILHQEALLKQVQNLYSNMRETERELEVVKLQLHDATHQIQTNRKLEDERQITTASLEDLLIKHLNPVNIEGKQLPSRTNQPSYAEAVRTRIPQQEFPKLMITPTSEKMTMADLVQQLNKLPHQKIPDFRCRETRQGAMLLACANASDLGQLKKVLEDPGVSKVVNVKELEPRKTKIIIFGAPEVPNQQQQPKEKDGDDEEEVKEDEFQKYIDTFLRPALERALKIEDPEFRVIKVFSGKNPHRSNIIIELRQTLARQLYDKVIYLGFTRCTVRQHIMVFRCFNCQQLGHTSSMCKNKVACGLCAGPHETRVCKEKHKKCVNCSRTLTKQKGSKNLDSRAKIEHSAFDSRCPAYRKAMEAAIQQAQRASGKFPV